MCKVTAAKKFIDYGLPTLKTDGNSKRRAAVASASTAVATASLADLLIQRTAAVHATELNPASH